MNKINLRIVPKTSNSILYPCFKNEPNAASHIPTSARKIPSKETKNKYPAKKNLFMKLGHILDKIADRIDINMPKNKTAPMLDNIILLAAR